MVCDIVFYNGYKRLVLGLFFKQIKLVLLPLCPSGLSEPIVRINYYKLFYRNILKSSNRLGNQTDCVERAKSLHDSELKLDPKLAINQD